MCVCVCVGGWVGGWLGGRVCLCVGECVCVGVVWCPLHDYKRARMRLMTPADLCLNVMSVHHRKDGAVIQYKGDNHRYCCCLAVTSLRTRVLNLNCCRPTAVPPASSRATTVLIHLTCLAYPLTHPFSQLRLPPTTNILHTTHDTHTHMCTCTKLTRTANRHSLTHSAYNSLSQPFTHSLAHSATHSLTHSGIRSDTLPLTH